MKSANVRLDRQHFTAVRVELKKQPAVGSPPEPVTPASLTGLSMISNVAGAAEPGDDPHQYAVSLEIKLDDSAENEKFPYLIHVQTLAFFRVRKGKFADREARLNYVLVHALPRLYASICELVAELTARSWHGVVELPMMEFESQYRISEDADAVSTTA
ncbi:hypothetical protein [Ralstonia solanacearum]|uniref:hypothetical protein n=1 Tax=Ralstonia solanacearum TaxID=305 RepID=UPI000F60D220|nr:hypothetical protein [Ralstonia solanacearum]